MKEDVWASWPRLTNSRDLVQWASRVVERLLYVSPVIPGTPSGIPVRQPNGTDMVIWVDDTGALKVTTRAVFDNA